MKGRVSIRGPRVPDLPDLDDSDLVRTVREFEPAVARNLRLPGIGRIKVHPWRHPTSGIRLLKSGGIEFLPARHHAGALSIPLYWEDDEFIPVMEYAAHLLARRIWIAVRRGERKSAIATRLGVSVQIVEVASGEPQVAVPMIIRELRSEFRAVKLAQRSLEKRRAVWKHTLGADVSRRRQLYALEMHLRSFLNKPQLQLVQRVRS